MEKSLFLNGIFDEVLEEIFEAQKSYLGKSFYIQPYGETPIKYLQDNLPNEINPVKVYMSTTKKLNIVCYEADIVGWEDKRLLTMEQKELLDKHFQQFQSYVGECYLEWQGKKPVNLISIKNLKKLPSQLPVEELIKTSDGLPLKKRTRAGGWSYVFPLKSL
jgi:5-methylcytosine-specific restriction enzyme A